MVPELADKAPKWYDEDVREKKAVRKTTRPAKLRSSLQPGTVLIILAGRYRGKRVVLLKQLEDTLVITGPFKINGVPIRRVNAAYVIATSQHVDLAGVDVSKFTKEYFARSDKRSKLSSRKTGGESEFFEDASEKSKLSETRLADQKAVDKALLETIKQTPLLSQYLASIFSLRKGDRPHLMKF